MCVASEVFEIPGPALMPHCGVEDARPRALQCGMAGMLQWVTAGSTAAFCQAVLAFRRAQPGTIGKLWGWYGYTDSASLPLSTHVWYMCKVVTFTEELSAPMVCHIYQTITIGGQLLTKAFTRLCIWYSLSNPEDVCEHSKDHSRISLVFTYILRILIVTYISTSDKD